MVRGCEEGKEERRKEKWKPKEMKEECGEDGEKEDRRISKCAIVTLEG